MPLEKLDTSLEYYLVSFDKEGKERPENEGLLSQEILRVLSSQPITDVFLLSHGWLGDVPAAKNQYQKWITAMANNQADIQKMQQIRPGFRPLLIGMHWPSKPWGNENINTPVPSFDITQDSELQDWIEEYAREVSDTEATKQALRTILSAQIEYETPPENLPAEVLAAYEVLLKEASLDSEDEDNHEWSENEALDLDPLTIYQAELREQSEDVSFEIGDRIESARNSFLRVPRLISFWKMKDLARQIGQTSGFNLLTKLQEVTDGSVRFHLMGHSFGCIFASATVAGSKTNHQLVRPINSLTLIQGALSLWSFCSSVPHRKNLPGYFHRIITERKVAGPIITTQSYYDRAVRVLYPKGGRIGLALGQDIDFDVTTQKYPTVGGIGCYGIQGAGLDIINMDMLTSEQSYDFQPGKIYNLESSKYIFVPQSNPFADAHSAIDKPEVAHAVWSAALVS